MQDPTIVEDLQPGRYYRIERPGKPNVSGRLYKVDRDGEKPYYSFRLSDGSNLVLYDPESSDVSFYEISSIQTNVLPPSGLYAPAAGGRRRRRLTKKKRTKRRRTSKLH